MNESSEMASATDIVDFQLPRVVHGSKNLSYYVGLGAILCVAWFFQSKKHGQIDVPFYKAAKTKWIFAAESLILDSYNKFRDTIYQIRATEGVQVLVPAKYLPELKGLPEDVLSAQEAVSEALMTKYTKFGLGHNAEMLSTLIRVRLSQNLARLVPQLKGELESIVATEFPECNDWTPVRFQPFALRAISRISGRAFVGPSINRSEQWMDTSINFAIHVFTAVVKLQFFPEWSRPAAQYLVSELRQIRKDIDVAKKMLKPVIEERLRDMEMHSAEEKPDDLIQWLVEALPTEEKTDYEAQAHIQLVLAAASIHTTTNLVTDCMYDLAAHPEVQEMLREEAHQVLEVEEGWLRKESMAKLKKLDSFMKETQRLAGNITGFIRKVLKPITLSDGTRLPPGTKLLTPQAGISHDERFFADPETFDAMRFYKMRQASEEEGHRWQFSSIGDTNVNFGAGRHACPGRFFAGNEIKMVLAYFLLRYEVRLKEGEGRPKGMMMVMSKMPDPNAELLFRRRTVD
ncbi:ent-kaurene oxidase [Verticillium alfalfae VaMs.102]|uniref:Ent-kaurene oxidase n=1 Tax=Verticillium alfalfae (strain VaMs.102 / ATCC MYA-4576 / FGSC 10136) TaxID=526221 RepID=C9SXE5_VERA1|nr:ent-kaurene oxidase [Verticillium alfalfae VaMs.102]EEY23335.1 ent-kaurene oxidase [Verticillium alfalfae VaMs.102]